MPSSITPYLIRLSDLQYVAMKAQSIMPIFPNEPAATIPERFKGLIFDCDGTLVDTMPLHFSSLDAGDGGGWALRSRKNSSMLSPGCRR